MFNFECDYTNGGLNFNYLNLKKYLFELYKRNIDNINIFLLVSLEEEYYHNKNLKKIIKDFIILSNTLATDFDILDENGMPTGKKTEKVKFKVNKISLDVGDTANRHRWIYRYNEEYMLENNLTDEKDIPQNIVNQITLRSYETSKQQGIDWFRNHAIPALNEILSENRLPSEGDRQSECVSTKLSQREFGNNHEIINTPSSSDFAKGSSSLVSLGRETIIPLDFQLTDGITQLFEGSDTIPPIEYICYDYWLAHPEYKTVEKTLLEVINLPNSIVGRGLNNEVDYYIERTNKRGIVEKFHEMFAKYSKMYLFDEAIAAIIKHNYINNSVEFYWFGMEPRITMAIKGRKGQNNETIKNYSKNELRGAVDRKFVSIKEKR